MPIGRPTDYKGKETNKLVFKLSLLGSTDKEMASVLDITETTLNNWKEKFPEFIESIKKGKDEADAKVIKSLYKRAQGYSFTEVRTETGTSGEYTIDKTTTTKKHIPSDVAAAIFWLKNRQGKNWNNRIPIDDNPDDKPILENGDKLPEDEK